MSNDGPRDDPPSDDPPDDTPSDDDTQSQSDDAPSDDDRRPDDDPPSGGRPPDGRTEDWPTKYCVECGARINAKAEICPECGVRQPARTSGSEDRITAALLAIVLGTFGAHKFYLGETGVGVVYLCFSWTFVPTVLGIVEGAIYLSKTDEQFREQYLE